MNIEQTLIFLKTFNGHYSCNSAQTMKNTFVCHQSCLSLNCGFKTETTAITKTWMNENLKTNFLNYLNVNEMFTVLDGVDVGIED